MASCPWFRATTARRSIKMLVSAAESGVIASFFCFIIIFGSFSNAVIVLTYLRWRKTLLSHPKDVLIFSLAIGDFVSSFLACPFGFSSAIARQWLWGHSGCVWYAFITTWVGLASIIQLAMLAVERFITLRSPTPNIVSAWQTFQAVLACWSLTFLVSCLPLIGWSNYSIEGLGLHCAITWDRRSVGNMTFGLFLLILFFIAPVGAILVSYVKILVIVRRMFKNADRIWGPEAEATKECYTAQVKTSKQLVFMTIGFLCAWSPYAIVCALIVFFDAKIPLGAREYPSMFAKTAVIYNPIIYFFNYPRLRKHAFKTLKCTNRFTDEMTQIT